MIVNKVMEKNRSIFRVIRYANEKPYLLSLIKYRILYNLTNFIGSKI